MARRHRTRKHKSKKRQTRRKQHRGGSKNVRILYGYESPKPGSGLANYTAANKARMNELKKYYENLNRQENEELARKEKEAVQQKAYAAELKRTAGLQKLAQEEEAELANIQRKFKKGRFVPRSNLEHIQNQLAYLQQLERSASPASNPGSVGSNSN